MTETRPRLGRGALGGLAVGCIGLQLGGSLPLAALSLAIWLAALRLGAPAQLRRLWRPRFWAISLLFALGSGLLLGQKDLWLGPVPLSSKGLQAGALMVVRGAFLFGLMNWASGLVADEDVRRAIRRAGLEQFGDALAAAFGLLPSLGARVRPALSAGRGAGIAGRLRSLDDAAVGLVRHAALLARELESGTRGPFVAAIVGPPGSGKTSLMHAVVERLRVQGVRVGGVTQPSVRRGEPREGYRLRDAASGEEIDFAERAGRGFEFRAEGWGWARERIGGAFQSAECVVIDELGRLEAEGQGHLEGLAIPAGRRGLLAAVREDCASAIAGRVGAFTLSLSAGASQAEVDAFVAELLLGLRPAVGRVPQPVSGELEMKNPFVLRPIGVVRSAFKTTRDIPLTGGRATLELDPRFAEGLEGLEHSSHLMVMGLLHLADRTVLKARPMKFDPAAPARGVFASRSPVRPNPVSMTVVPLLSRDGPRLEVDRLDLLDGTPIVDLKAYCPACDSIFSARHAHRVGPEAIDDARFAECLERDLENFMGAAARAEPARWALAATFVATRGFGVDPHDPALTTEVNRVGVEAEALMAMTGAAAFNGRLGVTQGTGALRFGFEHAGRRTTLSARGAGPGEDHARWREAFEVVTEERGLEPTAATR